MNKIISPLRLGNVGQPVADLQAGLAVLGFSIVSSEVTSQTFGASTQLAVQAFQGREHLQATGGVDAPTAARLNHRLAAPAEDRFFSVQGEVVRPDGKPLPGHRVHAFDRALCDWRELVDTRVNEVRTDKAGRYRIVYDPAQLEAWGKTRADLKVEISDPSDDVVLAQSPLILSALPQELVNFAIGDQLYRGPDEYTQVEAGLAPQLGSLADLSCLGAADVLILARDAKLPSSSVAYYVKAQRWASELNAPAALFYGLMRRNQPTRSGALLTRPLRRLWSALEEANAQNIIQLPLDAELRTRLTGIQQHYLAQPEHPHTQLLNTTALSTEQQSVFTRLFTSGELTGDAFWSSLEADSDFSAAQVTELRNTFALQAFAANNTSLTIQLRSVLNVRAAREVAAFSVEAWRDRVLTDSVAIPDEIQGETEPARRAAYAQLLYRSAELHYPTASLAAQMTGSPEWANHPVSAFFATYPDFEFGDERITHFLQAHPELPELFPDAQSAKADLLRVEQLFHLVPPEDKLAVIQPLWNAGLRSAPQIAFLGRHRLLGLQGELDRKVTTGIYRKAVHITSVALHVYLRYHPRLNRLSPYAVRTPQLPREQDLARDATTLPEWEALFGSTDACECSPCQSALSPAAYLVEMLAFLQRAVATDGAGRNALDELLDRRPDLGTLQLTCENTQTELPQIDLVCELLEDIAASPDQALSGASGSTTWDSAQLAAQPEHFNPAAYDLLRAATYPFNRLPFDLWLEEGRRYLKQMGIARAELMSVMPPLPDVKALEIATEALQMSKLESEIIRAPNASLDDLAASWGVDLAAGTLRTQLGHVETLLLKAGIDYNALLRLLSTRYLNADRLITVSFVGDPCALDGAELTRADGSAWTGEEFRSFLDRLHRFLRLHRRLGWTEYELDSMLAALGVEDFNASRFLSQLAAVQSLREAFALSPDELSSWWSDLSAYAFEEDVPSHYEAVFGSPSMFPDTHTGSGPDLRNDVFALTIDRTDLALTTSTDPALSRWLAESDNATPPTFTLQQEYSAYLQSATRLSAEDLQLLVEELLPKDTISGHVALNLANVSLLYRVASFVRAIKSSVQDYLMLQRITGMSPLHTSTLAAGPLDSLNFHIRYRELDAGNWSIDELAYLLLHEADAAAELAPTPEDMDTWLLTMSPNFAGVRDMRPVNVSPELKTALTQSLGSTLGVDSVVLDALLFKHRPALGHNLLAHLIIDANPAAANPPTPTTDFHAVFETVHKFGLAWKGLGLDVSHLAFVLDQGPGVGWTDIAALPTEERTETNFGAWRRLAAAAGLQGSVFTLEQSLFGLLQAAVDAVANSAAFVLADFLAQVSLWSGWPLADVKYLTGPAGFNLVLPDAMRDERPFVALQRAFDLFRRAGVSAEQAHAWASTELTYTETQSIKQALTLSYAPAQWLDVLATIQDELRPLRRDALLGHLLHTLGFKDSTAFYHHYLIDPEQAACTRTSRIVEALAAVQIFAQRILFNLELFEFPPEDAEAWQWRKNYRVWEAARKVFLYPENWLEPEWRTDKSAFFQELENGLSQDDVNLDTAERLYHDYLYKLDQVSRLEIMGMYEDTWTDGGIETNILHVFGRTRDIPSLYYYRRCEDQVRWTPWQPVALDIKGDHLIPIVFNGRLYLFWPDFKLTPIEPDVAKIDEEIAELDEQIVAVEESIDKMNKAIDDLEDPDDADIYMSDALELQVKLQTILQESLERQRDVKSLDRDGIIDDTPANEVEIGMAWSTYSNGRWSSKRIASSVPAPIRTDFRPKDFYFTGWISSDDRLYLAIRANRIVESSGPFSDVGGGPMNPFAAGRLTGPVASTSVEKLDVGFFTFDDCQSKLLFVADNDMSSNSSFPIAPEEVSARARVKLGAGLALEPLPILTVPTGSVNVIDSQQSFNARKLTGTDLSFELGTHDPADIRLLLGSVNESDRKVHYAHQRGLGGNELSPFFYTDDQRSYFVRPQPEAWVRLGGYVLTAASQQRASRAARIAPLTGQTGLSTATHYQGTSASQIVDRGPQAVNSAAEATWVDTILSDGDGASVGAVPAVVQSTDFRYQFTRFYHPCTTLLIRQLSRYGVEGLLNPIRDLNDDSENLYRQLTPLVTFDFEATYVPNSDWVLGNYDAEVVSEKIDFDHNSPYGPYNWELFFHIPLLMATRLMQNQRFAEARRWFHYIFNPTWSHGVGPERFWKIKPFYEAQLGGPTETLQELIDLLENGSDSLEQQIQQWEREPFDPHALARLRITAYMQVTVRKYLECIIKEADMLFTRDTREYVNEAVQLYLLAAEILGERPTLLPGQEATVTTPNLLLNPYRGIVVPQVDWGTAIDSVMDQLTSRLPTRAAGVPASRSGFRASPVFETPGTALDNAGQSVPAGTSATSAQGGVDSFNTLFLFCIPQNDLLSGYWDTVADRLFKIRHSMSISGQFRQLALFAPPIDPALLVRAFAAGLDIDSIVSGLYASLPNYRFNVILQKALELCGEVRSLGGALLSALEKKDAEELSALRTTHEVSLLAAIRAIKQKAIDEADSSLAGLLKTKASAEFRAAYYSSLERVSSGEQKSLDSLDQSRQFQSLAEWFENLASTHNLLPNVSVGIPTGGSVSFGGSNAGAATQATAGQFRAAANAFSYESGRSATVASYDRRLKDWQFQADLAKKEIAQLDKQILGAEIRKQIAETDLTNHDKQIAQSAEVEEFLKMKFSNQQLYSWMVSKLSSVHFQCFQLAYGLAKQAEQAFRHELGPDERDLSFFEIPYWDSLKKGLLAGEQLALDLRRMEKAHLDANRRELEITKPVSLFQLDAPELLKLRQTGACDVHIPEVMFDLDFAGHYFRRIKAVRLTMPGVTGPYTNVSATLSLTQSWTRREIPDDATVAPESDVTVLPQTAIATSNGTGDSGTFELNFNDPRYLPFEGAGAISTWHLELPSALRPFDYNSIADVVLHVSYTARAATDGGAFRDRVNASLVAALNDWKKLASNGEPVPPSRLFSLRREFPNEWNRLTELAEGQPQQVTLSLGKQHFPRYLDFLWSSSNGALEAQPISLSFRSAEVILDPIGSLPPEGDTPELALSGLTDISNDAQAEAMITVQDGILDAGRWRDLYLLVDYEVVA